MDDREKLHRLFDKVTDGAATPAEMEQLGALRANPELDASWKEWEQIARVARGIGEMPLPPGFEERLMKRIQGQPPAPAQKKRGPWWLLLGGVAVLVVGGLLARPWFTLNKVGVSNGYNRPIDLELNCRGRIQKFTVDRLGARGVYFRGPGPCTITVLDQPDIKGTCTVQPGGSCRIDSGTIF